MIALLVKHQVVQLSHIWSYMSTDNDKLKNLLARQKESLNYQYKMLFISVMNAQGFAQELKGKQIQQNEI